MITVFHSGPSKVLTDTKSHLSGATRKGKSMKQNQDMSRVTANAPLQCQSKAANLSNAKARLLLVEDHDVNQILIQAMTKRLGYETELASDGTEAVAKITQSISDNHPFDLVLMDIQMPFMDGYEATRIIRASGISVELLPIIAITANAFGDDIRNCLEAGMQAHISKPVDFSNLESVLQHWLKPRKLLDNISTAKEVKSDLSEDLVRRYRLRKEEAINSVVRFVRKGTFSDNEIRAIRDQLHKLAGTAAMFGERELGDHAKLIEDGLNQWKIMERPQKMLNALEHFLEAA
jgi:CheY-like chemotaxis protein/HPt (histidine-containing phosphotransfer) domain-containing protein